VLPEPEAEQGLVYSLLRGPGEEINDALLRVASLPIAIEPADISDKMLNTLLALILENAEQEVATSIRLAAQALEVDEFDLVQGVERVDHGAIRVYAEAVAYHSARRDIVFAANKATDAARNQAPSEALDTISQEFAGIVLASEKDRIASVTERAAMGRISLEKRQASMRNGEVRVVFPMEGINTLVPYLLPGQVILCTGGTKTGKSSWAGQFFDYNVKRGMKGLLFHFEDTPEVMDLRRVARQMPMLGEDGVPLRRLLGEVLSQREHEKIEQVRADIAEWGHRGTEIYAAGWTMEQVIRIWHRLCIRASVAGDPIQFVIVDYLNKAELSPQKLKNFGGVFGSRGRDAELVKQATEATGTLSLLVQQEGINGHPYETKQSAQKSQVWISLARDRLDNHALNPVGEIIVKNANLGSTGSVPAEFWPRWMLWHEL